MRHIIFASFLGGVVLGQSRELFALDQGHSKALQYMKFKGSDSGEMVWILAGGLGLILLVGILVKIYQAAQERRIEGIRAPQKKRSMRSFKERASELGFKIGEAKTLRNIAGRLAPRSPGVLLTTDKGRASLIDDLSRRIHRREREIEVLQGVKEKLERIRDQGVHAREKERIEADIPVWIVKKMQKEVGEDGEDVFVNVEQIPGQLLDLSEDGAALSSTGLEAQVGDLLDFWSADTQIWFSPLLSSVLNVERKAGSDEKVFHLHFIDPPLTELRQVIQLLQMDDDYELALRS